MSARLEGKVCLVTGATGIAGAGARRFSAEGAAVHIVSLDAAQCEASAAGITALGGHVTWTAADLRDEGQTRSAVAATIDEHGRIDGLFAVAGGSGRKYGDGPVHEIPVGGWAATVTANLDPAFLAMREVIRAKLEVDPGPTSGAIVLVSSVLATHPIPALFATHAYAAAKGGIDALTRTAAAYYAPHAIRVNAIAPGLVDTPMAARAMADPETAAYVARKQPLAGGLLSAESIAAAAAFLLSDEANGITGQVLAVDGGWGVTEAGP